MTESRQKMSSKRKRLSDIATDTPVKGKKQRVDAPKKRKAPKEQRVDGSDVARERKRHEIQLQLLRHGARSGYLVSQATLDRLHVVNANAEHKISVLTLPGKRQVLYYRADLVSAEDIKSIACLGCANASALGRVLGYVPTIRRRTAHDARTAMAR